jgi:hypothetical protein
MLRQWQMRLERAEYEAALAERRYHEVDPSQRLVVCSVVTGTVATGPGAGIRTIGASGGCGAADGEFGLGGSALSNDDGQGRAGGKGRRANTAGSERPERALIQYERPLPSVHEYDRLLGWEVIQ